MNDKNDIQNKYEKAYPHIWNQFTLYYQVRERIESKWAAISLLTSILVVLFFQLESLDKSPHFFIPLILLLIALGFSVFHLRYRRVTIPWVEKKDLEEVLKPGTEAFYKEMVDDIYSCTSPLREYADIQGKYIQASWWAIVLAVLSYIFILCDIHI